MEGAVEDLEMAVEEKAGEEVGEPAEGEVEATEEAGAAVLSAAKRTEKEVPKALCLKNRIPRKIIGSLGNSLDSYVMFGFLRRSLDSRVSWEKESHYARRDR